MKRYQFIIVVIVIILITTLLGAGVSQSASPPCPSDHEVPLVSGWMTFVPIPTTFLIFVNIPDPNLNEALHTKLGKPMSEGIMFVELAGLTGVLYLENKNISDAEGIQYCTNISGLYMDNNDLTSLPDMSGMTGLTSVSFAYNDFTEFPTGLVGVPNLSGVTLNHNPISSVSSSVTSMTALTYLSMNNCAFSSFPESVTGIPNLQTLRMVNNSLGSITNSITAMGSLRELRLENTGLDEFPTPLYSMNHITSVNLNDNSISSISGSISGMSSLEHLFLSQNELQYLPDEICSLTHLKGLYIDENSLYALPSNIGSTNLEQISARLNRISRLPSSIGSASSLYLLDVMVNRIRELPNTFDDKSYDFINIDFNFIDMSPGSDSRTIIDNTTSFTKYFERQLKPIEEVIAEPTAQSVVLTWDAGENGTGSSGSTWNVDSYNVFLIEGGNTYTKLEELLPTEHTYEHSGLTPETTYLYRVGVDYHVVEPGHSIDTIIRAYTEVEPTTLALPAASPSPSTAAETEAPSAETTETPSETDTQEGIAAETEPPSETSAEAIDDETKEAIEIDIPSDGTKSGLPVWAIVVICVLGAGVIGTGVTLIVIKVKGDKNKYAKRA